MCGSTYLADAGPRAVSHVTLVIGTIEVHPVPARRSPDLNGQDEPWPADGESLRHVGVAEAVVAGPTAVGRISPLLRDAHPVEVGRKWRIDVLHVAAEDEAQAVRKRKTGLRVRRAFRGRFGPALVIDRDIIRSNNIAFAVQ